MSSPLHTATVGTWLQMLPQVALLLDKAEAHCREHGLPDAALLDARLAPDMWNFSKQVMYCVLNSAGAVAGLRSGEAGPDLTDPPTDFATLRAHVARAIEVVRGVEPGEMDAGAERDVTFSFTGASMEYVGIDYLLSFSVPNFFFHVGMAYAVLRQQGLPVGKRHFLGKVRVKPAAA